MASQLALAPRTSLHSLPHFPHFPRAQSSSSRQPGRRLPRPLAIHTLLHTPPPPTRALCPSPALPPPCAFPSGALSSRAGEEPAWICGAGMRCFAQTSCTALPRHPASPLY
eukprot:352307-Chlamydomonas_euryale.AAC.1